MLGLVVVLATSWIVQLIGSIVVLKIFRKKGLNIMKSLFIFALSLTLYRLCWALMIDAVKFAEILYM